MNIFKCMVGLSDGSTLIIDGVRHEEKLWLVPQWIEDQKKGTARPVRIIRFDHLPFQFGEEGPLYQNIQLPIPKTALLAELPPGIEYVDLPHGLLLDIQELRQN